MIFDSLIGKFITFNESSIILGALIATFVLYRLFYKTETKKYNLPPGPTGLPFLGYLPFLGATPHRTFHELSKKYGNVFSLYLGQTLTVVCNDWPSTEEAFNKTETADRPPGLFDALPNGFGHGGENGKEWIEQRKFTVKTMKDVGLGRPQWENMLQEEIDEIIKEIREHKSQPLDIRQTLATTFTNNIMSLLFGHRLPSGHSAALRITEAVDSMVESFAVVSPNNFLPRLFNFLNSFGLFGSTKARQILKEFSKFFGKYVEEEVKKFENDNESFVGIYHREMKQQKSNPKSYITEKSFYGNVQVLLFAGAETTRTALVWLLLAVTKHPDVQEKIHKELDSVLGKDGKILWSERAKVPYTYGAIMEAMRWESFVPLNSLRMTNANTTIQGYDVPKGTVVVVNQWALHNDPKYWPEPHKFLPERFLLDDGKEINSNPQSFVPFSIGRRNCPGKLIALLEIFQYFIAIMRNFTLLPPEDGKINYDIILGLTFQAKNVNIRFIPREEMTSNQNGTSK